MLTTAQKDAIKAQGWAIVELASGYPGYVVDEEEHAVRISPQTLEECGTTLLQHLVALDGGGAYPAPEDFLETICKALGSTTTKAQEVSDSMALKATMAEAPDIAELKLTFGTVWESLQEAARLVSVEMGRPSWELLCNERLEQL